MVWTVQCHESISTGTNDDKLVVHSLDVTYYFSRLTKTEKQTYINVNLMCNTCVFDCIFYLPWLTTTMRKHITNWWSHLNFGKCTPNIFLSEHIQLIVDLFLVFFLYLCIYTESTEPKECACRKMIQIANGKNKE